MTNPNPNSSLVHSFMVFSQILIIASFLLLVLLQSSLPPIDALVVDSERGRNESLEWQVLTKKNFSSQISLHHHVLLMITVPWCGESRALMRKMAQAAMNKLEKFNHIRLMVIYRNDEKMLAKTLCATAPITIIFYNHAMPYKYQGRLRVQNILTSLNYFTSLQSDELPLKLLNTPEDLETFLQSTDKAILLLEFCGWTPILLGKIKSNGSKNAFHARDVSDNGIISGSNDIGEADLKLTSSREKNQKGLNNEDLACDINNGHLGTPWLGGFTLANDSSASKTEDTELGYGLSCNGEEFERFESFFSNFTTYAREFFLPPEKQRFGLISKRSLLSSMGVQDPESWLVMLQFSGCPNCSKILKDEVDLRSALNTNHLPVSELESENHDVEPALPAHRPSIIIFVDRSSGSPDARKKSKEALEIFRKLALQNHLSYQMDTQNHVTHRKISGEVMGGKSTSDPPNRSGGVSLKLARGQNLKNVISLMTTDDNTNIVLDNIHADAKGRSIQDILAYLLQQNKEAKLSSLAKEAGFQLLSDDVAVKITELLPLEKGSSKSDDTVSKVPDENIIESIVNLESNNGLDDAILTQVMHEEQSGPTNVESQVKEEKVSYIGKNTQMIPVEPDRIFLSSRLGVAQDMLLEDRSSRQILKLEVQQTQRQEFSGVYFFSDGDYRLLQSLTAGMKIPSIVIVDPLSEQHYICPEEAIFSFSYLQGFLDAFLNGSLVPYQRSEFVSQSPREATRPPFINLDFHEVDSIPRITAHTFSELVLRCNQSDTQVFGCPWKKDVLVLFSNNWCGFCQRMELVVREVFRAFVGYMNMLNGASKNKQSTSSSDMVGDVQAEFPLIFLMDCTLNDCSSLLKLSQRDLYPALILYPAQRKPAVSYRGDMSVNNVIKFLIDHGSNFHHLQSVKDILWTAGQKGDNDEVTVEDASQTLIHDEDSEANAKSHEVLLKNREPDRSTPLRQIRSRTSNDQNDVSIGSVLIATDKLLIAPPFDKSVILIVQANRSAGFIGLIINKHISWDSFEGLRKGSEMVKQAPISFGGPVISNEMPLVSLTRGVSQEGYSEVFLGVYFLDQLTTARELERFKLGNLSSNEYWFFLGYSSWGWNQLFAEIAEGAWQISDPIVEFNFPGNQRDTDDSS